MARTIPTDDDLFDFLSTEAQLDRAALRRDLPLQDSGIQSLNLISIVFEAEERYAIHLEDNDITDCATLGELVDGLKARIRRAWTTGGLDIRRP